MYALYSGIIGYTILRRLAVTVKVITSTLLRSTLSEALDDVTKKNEPILVRRNKEADAALISVDLLEDLLEMKDKSYVKSIEEARKNIRQGQTFSYDEIFAD